MWKSFEESSELEEPSQETESTNEEYELHRKIIHRLGQKRTEIGAIQLLNEGTSTSNHVARIVSGMCESKTQKYFPFQCRI